jgi:hypothetical protein
MFGLVKKQMQRHYSEGEVSTAQLPLFVVIEQNKFRGYDMTALYRKCGYEAANHFNPGILNSCGPSIDDSLLGFDEFE